jgi:hypothetical protein
MTDIAVLLPLRIETRFKSGDLWLRVVPDEPWFLRDDPRITPDELLALRRYVDAPPTGAGDAVPPAWRDLANQVGGPRATALHRRFVVRADDGTLTVRTPDPAETRIEPVLPSIAGFPSELVVWAGSAAGLRELLRLTVDRSRLLADFADPDIPGDKRWWEDWDEAVAIGLAGVVPAAAIADGIEALYVTGIGDADPAALFASLAGEGRIGLLAPGTPTNSVDGAQAAPLANDAETWWQLLQTPAGDADRDVSLALTGDSATLGNLPGGDRPQRPPAAALVTVLWPALWGFAAGQVYDIARGPVPARWAASAMFPEGAYPTVRIGPQPYGLLPTTAWTAWQAADEDPGFEASLVPALVALRQRHARQARTRGTAADKDTAGLMDLIADTPTSTRFRYRLAWPLELWWLAMVGSGVPQRWQALAEAWLQRYRLADELGVRPFRRYGARGTTRLVGIPLVVPRGSAPSELPGLLEKLADAALAEPTTFASTERVESIVLDQHGDSLLIRLAIRSLQLLIAELRRERDHITSFDPEPFARNSRQPGRLQQLIAEAAPIEAATTTPSTHYLIDVANALRALGSIPVGELERMLAAAIDCSSHRVDPWLVALPQRRFDAMSADGAPRRLGAYGWVDAPAPGAPGPTAAGLLHTPSTSTALAAAVLRDRAVSEASSRWDLDITSRKARVADRLAEHVRRGSQLAEAIGREVERIVGTGAGIDLLRRRFPVRQEHEGRRVCDGLRALAAEPFPLDVDETQAAALQELRDGLDGYADLIVADAVHHLVEGRADVAGATMEGAAGLNRPPELGILRTPREGRAVSTSVLLALAHVPDQPPPTAEDDLAVVPPATTLDPSVAAFLATESGDAGVWDFEVRFPDDAGLPGPPTVVRLAQLGLAPADALALTRTRLEGLAVELAADIAGVDLTVPGVTGNVTSGSAGSRYEHASRLVALIGRNPARPRDLSEEPSELDPAGEAVDEGVLAKYAAARQIGVALQHRLQALVSLLGQDGHPTEAEEADLRRLLRACAGWGIAPDPPRRPDDATTPSTPADRRRVRLVDAAVVALHLLDDRLAAAPEPPAAGQLSRSDFLDRAAALVSATGQVALSAAVPVERFPALQAGDGPAGLDTTWLTVAAAVRPALARLEAHQLLADPPLRAWSNRVSDPWQTDGADRRRMVATYASLVVDLSLPSSGETVAVAALDRFSEVIPAAEQFTGAAFGFDAPAARPQQAILLAVPPDPTTPLNQETVVQIVAETRELAHARMARPVDLDRDFWALAPTGLLPVSGTTATMLEVRS